MFKNKEGYTDPTAGAAMASIMKEYRQNQRRIYRKHSEIKTRPKGIRRLEVRWEH